MGNAIAIGLRKGLIDAGVDRRYDAELVDLSSRTAASSASRSRATATGRRSAPAAA